MHVSTAVLFLSLITVTTTNEMLADTFQQISTNVDMRDQALFQLIIGTVALFIISICVVRYSMIKLLRFMTHLQMGFMLIFQCYSSYCANRLDKKYDNCPMEAEIHARTISFRSVFHEEA